MGIRIRKSGDEVRLGKQLREDLDPRFRKVLDILFLRALPTPVELEDALADLRLLTQGRRKVEVAKATRALLKTNPNVVVTALSSSLQTLVDSAEFDHQDIHALRAAVMRTKPKVRNPDRYVEPLGQAAYQCKKLVMERCRDLACWILGITPSLRIPGLDVPRLSLACQRLIEPETYSHSDHQRWRQERKAALRLLKEGIHALQFASVSKSVRKVNVGAKSQSRSQKISHPEQREKVTAPIAPDPFRGMKRYTCDEVGKIFNRSKSWASEQSVKPGIAIKDPNNKKCLYWNENWLRTAPNYPKDRPEASS